MSCFYKDGLQFTCTRCSYCCRHSAGYVFLSQADITRAISYLDITEDEFVCCYCRKVNLEDEIHLSLVEKPNFDCIFWEHGTGCRIYPARPWQCQSYPFWPSLLTKETWQKEKSYCPGLGQGTLYSQEEIDNILAVREKEPLLTWSSSQGEAHD